jgi:hypothetical protein
MLFHDSLDAEIASKKRTLHEPWRRYPLVMSRSLVEIWARTELVKEPSAKLDPDPPMGNTLLE